MPNARLGWLKNAGYSIVNLTPHSVVLVDRTGNPEYEFESEGVARAEERSIIVDQLLGYDIVRTEYGAPTDLPDPQPKTWYIVSRITAEAARANGRTTDDLLLTSDVVRNDEGQIVGCRRFAVL